MAERSEAKRAKRIFASKKKSWNILTRSLANFSEIEVDNYLVIFPQGFTHSAKRSEANNAKQIFVKNNLFV